MYALDDAIQQATELTHKAFKHSAFAEVLEEAELEKISVEPSRTEFGDLACSTCFQFARFLKQAPQQIALEIAQKISSSLPHALLASVSADAGYVNFKLSPAYYGEVLKDVFKKGVSFGDGKEGHGKKVVIDYSSPNVGKPLHVGHNRCTILGDSIKRILRARGWKVIGSNYLCEAGTQVAMLLVGIRKYGAEKIADEKALVDYYVRINREIEGNEELMKEVRAVLEAMESGNKEILAELKKVRELSLPPIRRDYELLGVSFEEEIFDSDMVAPCKPIVEEAIKKGIAFKDRTGEIVAKLEDYGLPNIVLLRSNGTTLYSSRDLALGDYRWKKHKFDRCVYVTAYDQSTHFQQFFKILSLLGRPYAERLVHVGYGLISVPEGKFSTRAGRIVLIEELLKDATDEARKEIVERKKLNEQRTGEKYSEEEVEQTARAVGVGATKFAFLRVSTEKNIVFDSKRVVSFEGDTGAYVQYSLVRCQNILRKAGFGEKNMPKAPKFYAAADKSEPAQLDAHEKKLLKSIAEYPSIVSNAARSFAPNLVCDYLLKLCAEFSSFYEACPVIGAENGELRKQRLAMVAATSVVLKNALDLLGIQAPERM